MFRNFYSNLTLLQHFIIFYKIIAPQWTGGETLILHCKAFENHCSNLNIPESLWPPVVNEVTLAHRPTRHRFFSPWHPHRPFPSHIVHAARLGVLWKRLMFVPEPASPPGVHRWTLHWASAATVRPGHVCPSRGGSCLLSSLCTGWASLSSARSPAGCHAPGIAFFLLGSGRHVGLWGLRDHFMGFSSFISSTSSKASPQMPHRSLAPYSPASS